MTELPRVLLLPGWQNSDDSHWQSRWQQSHGFQRVEQADWHWPRRGDWMAQLEEAVLADPRPVALVAHSLGCHLVAAWAAHSQHTARIAGALLVAPPDMALASQRPQLRLWAQAVMATLPFRALLLYSDNDPYCSVPCACDLASAWGASAISLGAAGHVNGESGLGDWPDGLHWLQRLTTQPRG